MRVLLRKLAVALLIVLVSAYSYNAERREDLSEVYLRKGMESLRVLNYRDALLYFARAFSSNPESEAGELAYLYLGKAYALFSYASGSRRGILASIGYLNQYPFHYKVPRFIHVQREFVGDSYLILQWYGTAKNIYANLYGETERVEYLIKYSYASALEGSVEGFNYLRAVKSVSPEYLDLYYMTMGFYHFNLGKYETAKEYMMRAVEVNPYLREDPHLLFRLGVSYYKLGDWRRSILYLELSLRADPFSTYREKASFYLALINLETRNFREAFRNLESLTEDNGLFYRKVSQILFASLWYYDEFLEVYGERIGDYRKKLLQIGWLNVENTYGDLPLLGIYYLALKTGSLSEEEREFLKVKRPRLSDLLLENDLFFIDPFIKKVKRTLRSYRFYVREEAEFIRELYLANDSTFLLLFEDSTDLLVRSLVFVGDLRAKKLLPFLKDRSLSAFLEAQILIVEGKTEEALKRLETSLRGLKGDDRKEALMLIGYLKGDPKTLEDVLKEVDLNHPRFSGYATVLYLRLADIYFSRGDLARSAGYYRKVVDLGVKDYAYWWSLFRLALIGDRTGDRETISWVVNKVKGEDNIMSRVITTLWEG
ncbi:MAG: tetratricopeptide repeat protein [Aquificota bacterium]|nr:tetratricopeptide repeat protein [Aquificota bacterium]